MAKSERVAIVLMNLGGPDGPQAVKPFLFNLFYDPAIIRVPKPLRWLIAKLISRRRAPVAREIYSQIGGRSPILPLTEAQGAALEQTLEGRVEAKSFIAMRYWNPLSVDAARAVKAWGATRVVLLPLYPQYSTTTNESSFKEWARAAAEIGLKIPTCAVCCYPTEPGFINSHVTLLRQALAQFGPDEDFRILFSAHGLPKKVITDGDPYQRQVEQTCAAVAERAGLKPGSWHACFQSRVGPMEWIGPSTEAEIRQAGLEGKSLIVVPIAFVSEHSETLVELDIEYAHLAREAGVPRYVRVPALGTQPDFIEALAKLTIEAIDGGSMLCPEDAEGAPCTASRHINLEFG